MEHKIKILTSLWRHLEEVGQTQAHNGLIVLDKFCMPPVESVDEELPCKQTEKFMSIFIYPASNANATENEHIRSDFGHENAKGPKRKETYVKFLLFIKHVMPMPLK